MARVLRGYLVSGLEDVALWHERDISHSSVERIVLPDASMLAYYALRRMTRLIDGLVVNEERMKSNLLEGSLGLVFSQPVLLALVEAGCTRDDAYRIVQRCAHHALDTRRAFKDVLVDDAELASVLGEAHVKTVLDEAFDLSRSLMYAQRGIALLNETSP